MNCSDMVSGRQMGCRRTNEGTKRIIVHTFDSIPSKEIAQRLFLPYHTCHGNSAFFAERAFL